MTVGTLLSLDSSTAPGLASPTAYTNLQEHILDLAERFDLQIQRALLRAASTDTSDSSRLTASTIREVLTILNRTAREATANTKADDARALDDCLLIIERHIREREAATLAQGARLPWLDLVSCFGLSELEADVLFACFAVDLDNKYATIFGYLNNDCSRHLPTIGCVLALCASSRAPRTAVHRLFGADGILFASQLLHLADEFPDRIPLCQRAICIDARIAAYIAGALAFDPRLRDCMQWETQSALNASDAIHLAVSRQILATIHGAPDSQGFTAPAAFYLHGPSSTNRRLVAQEVCRALNLPLLRVDAEHLAALPIGFYAGVPLVVREAFLLHAALYLDKVEAVLDEVPGRLGLLALIHSLDMYHGAPTFIVGEHPWHWAETPTRTTWLPIELRTPRCAEQLANWQLALGGSTEFSETDVSRLASIHPLPLPEATAAVHAGRAAASLRGDCRVTLSDVARACRDLSQADFGQLARKLEGELDWNDLVLPPQTLEQLRDICVQAKYRCHVYGTWGFADKLPLGKGLNVLFSGKSGTGKTMSAQIIANDIGVNLYKIDLSQVVSKYIGETEKNLHQIFSVAHAANAILFFDEADALLGKRSDIKDAHDRYANLEVAYLLQKMEEYEGITILATNLRRNIDDAFARRIRFIVDFPFPSQDDRLRIWQRIWPQRLPLSPDIDPERLARQFKLSGGAIRNIAVCAAFLAAVSNEPVAMRHLTVAIKRELQKMGRLLDAESCEGLEKP